MTDHMHVSEALADRNIQKWLQAKHVQERLAKQKVEDNVGPYLVISRETGAGGSEIARKVGQKLGWDVLDKEIVDDLAQKYHTPRSLVEHVDERHVSWIEEVFTSWFKGQELSSAAYVIRLNRMLLLAAHHGNVVFVGRGARFVLPAERGLSVRILAPLDFRVEQVMLQQSMSAKEARRFVENTDRERERFIKDHYHHKAADPHLYDLVLNVEKLVQDDAVNLIVDATEFWLKQSGVTILNS